MYNCNIQQVNFPDVTAYDSITEEMCDTTKTLFGDFNDHKVKGGLQQMGVAMKKGMVLVMSLWDDHDANMLWLDSNYPTAMSTNRVFLGVHVLPHREIPLKLKFNRPTQLSSLAISKLGLSDPPSKVFSGRRDKPRNRKSTVCFRPLSSR